MYRQTFLLFALIACLAGCAPLRINVTIDSLDDRSLIPASSVSIADERTYDSVTAGSCFREHNIQYMNITERYFAARLSKIGNPLIIHLKQFQYCVADSGGSAVNIVPLIGALLYANLEEFHYRLYFKGLFMIDDKKYPIDVQLQDTITGSPGDRDEYATSLFNKLLSKAYGDLLEQMKGTPSK